MAERKPFLLRIDSTVLEGVQRWANDDLRSLNAQIEYLLRESLRRAGRAPAVAAAPPPERAIHPNRTRSLDRYLKRADARIDLNSRPSAAEVGRRQATAASGPGGALPADVLPLLRAVRRQRRGLLRPAEQRPAGAAGAIRLSDVNPDLIGCYRMVRDRTEAVIRALEALEREHRQRGDACYYDVRDQRFNPLRAALQARAANPATSPTRTRPSSRRC